MESELPTLRNFAAKAAMFEGGLVVAAVGLGWLLGQTPLESFYWSWTDLAWGLAATLPPLGVFWFCLHCPWRSFAQLVQMVEQHFLPLLRPLTFSESLGVCLLAGIGEEMLFRGVVQAKLTSWWEWPGGQWAALGAASLLFAALHALSPTYFFLAGLIGLYLGSIWLASDNLLVPIVAHAAYDLVAILYLTRIWDQKSSGP
jgi:membrane protease YdiL (CAAX protease family)